ncbi:hypothetical protein ASZ90_000774 [hydrocarbon metagenome]|uniref:Uncharacterized protein n=1 Tax=hydrocarbon metagenome TaxID=938273 RepID=A0A0W8G842_9ZZZZ
MIRAEARSGRASRAGAAFLPLAWNGLRLAVPEGWEPARLGRDYLGLESPDGPVMEIRFTRRPERLAPQEVVRRMLKKSPGEVAVGPETVPRDWLSAMPGRDSVGFDCGGLPVSRGVASLCRTCGTLVVARFFPAGEGDGGAMAREVLASIRDHGRDGPPFELYGIRLEPPQGMGLTRFSFKPGRFDLEFSGPGRTLGYSRLAPADVLLAGGDLAAFAGKHLSIPGVKLEFAPARWRLREAALAVTDPPARGVDMAVDGVMRFFRRRRQARVLVWREEAANKLAAVVWCGVVPADVGEFEKVCAGYGVF